MLRLSGRSYLNRILEFQGNARLYLLHIAVSSIAVGIFSLLFNFYLLDLGIDEPFLGKLLSVNNFAALVAALPAGYVSDRLGHKQALLLAGLGSVLAVTGIVLWPIVPVLFAMYVLLGVCQSMSGVTMAPFLMENSGERERSYLFSASFGIQMMAVTIGYWVGGRLPGWFGGRSGSGAIAASSYSHTLLFVAIVGLLALLPLVFVHSFPRNPAPDRLAPFRFAWQHSGLVGKLTAPLIITTLGAGLFVPFMNIFFRDTYHSSDAAIGTLFAAGSLAMAIGLLAAAPLADRYGNIRTVVLTQALSIPFMALLGFAPWFWLSAGAYLLRLILMNMTIPVYQAFAMEQVQEGARATVAALINMGYSFGYAISPAISGQLQMQAGFDPIFALAIFSYVIAIAMIWHYFGKRAHLPIPAVNLDR